MYILVDCFFEAPDVVRHIVPVIPAGDMTNPYLAGLVHGHDVVRRVVGVVSGLRFVVDQVVEQRRDVDFVLGFLATRLGIYVAGLEIVVGINRCRDPTNIAGEAFLERALVASGAGKLATITVAGVPPPGRCRPSSPPGPRDRTRAPLRISGRRHRRR